MIYANIVERVKELNNDAWLSLVERQHRLDGERFYSKLRMYSLADGRKQLAAYNKLSNTIPKCCLGFRSPNDVLSDYIHLF